MGQAKDLAHTYLEAPGLPYVPLNSPSSTVPVFVRGSNVLTTVLGDFQRRPGWTSWETSNQTVFPSIKRIYTWNRWNGDSYLIASIVDTTTPEPTSRLFKLKIGTDDNFIEITDAAWINHNVIGNGQSGTYAAVVSNDTLYVSNGIVSYRYDGTNLYNWGMVAPLTAPTIAPVSTGRTATAGNTYVYTYSSGQGGMSSNSPASATTGPYTNKQMQIFGARSGDPQVTQVHIFRTTDGGSSYFEILQSPIANPSSGTWTVVDTTADIDLNTGSQPNIFPAGVAIGSPDTPSINYFPPGGVLGLTWFQNRIWGHKNNTVYFTAWEESLNGLEEEQWNFGGDGDFYKFPGVVNALAVCATGLLVFLVDSIYLISGDARDTFIVTRLFNRLGCRGHNVTTTLGRSVVWLDTSDTIQITDGQQVEELGLPIRPDLVGIDHQQASLTTHVDGRTHWITLLDGGAGVCRVMNLDTKLWQVPWTFGGTAIHSGETSAGKYSLFLGATDGIVYTMTPDAYLDPGGDPYPAELVTSLFDLIGKDYSGHVGALEWLSVERDDHPLFSVERLVDDDPNNVNAIFTNIVGNVKTPAQREQGTFMLEEWFFSTEPRGRRISLKMTWEAVNSIFRVFSLDIAYSKLT